MASTKSNNNHRAKSTRKARTPAKVKAAVDANGFEPVRKDLGRIREDLMQLKDDAVGFAAERAQAAASSAKDGAHLVADRASKAAGEFRGFISRRPMTSLLIAVGAGAVLSRMLRRRH